MKIQVEVEIFDDPEYCSVGGKIRTEEEFCHRGALSLCRAFVNDSFSPISREYDGIYKAYRKCPQCKEAYQKAKDIEFMHGNREQWSEEKFRNLNEVANG
jgi:hypothetical protein